VGTGPRGRQGHAAGDERARPGTARSRGRADRDGAQPGAHGQGRVRLRAWAKGGVAGGQHAGESAVRAEHAGAGCCLEGARGHGREGRGRGPGTPGRTRLGSRHAGEGRGVMAGRARGVTAWRAREQGRRCTGRRGGRRGEGKREGDGGSPWGPKSSDNHHRIT
jgi:hypothetical protein